MEILNFVHIAGKFLNFILSSIKEMFEFFFEHVREKLEEDPYLSQEVD